MNFELTSEMLVVGAGVVISWLFSYTPKLKEWYDAQTSAQKGVIMFGAMAIISAAVYGLTCLNSPYDFGVTCDQAGIWKLAALLFYAVAGNQFAYLMSPQKKSPAVIKAQAEGESAFVDFPVATDDIK